MPDSNLLLEKDNTAEHTRDKPRAVKYEFFGGDTRSAPESQNIKNKVNCDDNANEKRLCREQAKSWVGSECLPFISAKEEQSSQKHSSDPNPEVFHKWVNVFDLLTDPLVDPNRNGVRERQPYS